MKTEIKWGVIFTLVAFIWVSLEYFMGFQTTRISQHPIVTGLFFIPAVLMIYLGIKEKKNEMGGHITFTQALTCGVLMSLVISLLSPVTQYIFHHFINPNFFKDMIEYAVLSGNSTPEEAQRQFSVRNYYVIGPIFGFIMGTVTSLIIAFFIRTKNA